MDTLDVLSPEYAQVLYEKIKVLPREYSGITEDARRIAREELNEKDEKMVEDNLKNLRDMFTEKDGWLRNLKDEILIRFLRARKFDLSRSLILLRNFHRYHLRYPELVETFSLENLQPAMEDLVETCLPYRTPAGCGIGIGRLKSWNTERTSFFQIIQFMLIYQDTELSIPMSQICGGVGIVDFRDIGWHHIRQFTPRNLMCYFTGLQNTFPFRLKEFHFVYNSKLFGIFFAMATPFLGKKLRARVKFHGDDMSSLHQYIPSEILPEEYGGHLGPLQNYGFNDLIRKNAPNFLKIYSDECN